MKHKRDELLMRGREVGRRQYELMYFNIFKAKTTEKKLFFAPGPWFICTNVFKVVVFVVVCSLVVNSWSYKCLFLKLMFKFFRLSNVSFFVI